MEDEQDVRIRQVRERDLQEVLKIEETAFPNPYPMGYLRYLAKTNYETFLVAEGRRCILGFIIADVRGRNEGHIISIAVSEKERRKGIARSLIGAVDSVFEKLDVDVVKLEVRTSNLSAINLYSSMGYRRVRKVRGYYKDGEDAIIMALSMGRYHDYSPRVESLGSNR